MNPSQLNTEAILAVVGGLVALISATVGVYSAITARRQTANTAKKDALEGLRGIVEANQAEAEDERNRNADLIERLRYAHDLLFEADEARLADRKKLDDALERLSHVEQEQARTEELLACTQRELAEARRENGKLKERVTALEEERAGLMERVRVLESERSRLAAEVERLQALQQEGRAFK